VSEVYRVDSWLYSVLHGDATLLGLVTGVYADLAPLEAVFPFVVFTLQDGSDVGTVNGLRIWTRATYTVRVVTDQPSYSLITAAADRIDVLLHRASAVVTGGAIISCVREEPLRYTETTGGKVYRHLGGSYRIQAQ
jgi:hypothetical protein